MSKTVEHKGYKDHMISITNFFDSIGRGYTIRKERGVDDEGRPVPTVWIVTEYLPE